MSCMRFLYSFEEVFLVHRRFLHGAGFWTLSSKRESHHFHHSTLGQCIALACALYMDSRLVDSLTKKPGQLRVFSALILRIERCRLLLTAAKFGRGPWWVALCAGSGWSAAALSDAACVFDAACQQELRAYRRAGTRARRSSGEAALERARWLGRLHDAGGISFHIKPSTVSEFVCPTCGIACLS